MNKPIPCVGFELLYSPVDRNCMENLGRSLHTKSNEFIFDVVRKVARGQEILIFFSNNSGPTEQLNAKVTNCIKLAKNHYQIALETCPDSGILIDNADLVCQPIIKGPSTAQEITLFCPSCNNKTSFHFIANQDGDWGKGILPIYNCSSCGTTRAMIGLIRSND